MLIKLILTKPVVNGDESKADSDWNWGKERYTSMSTVHLQNYLPEILEINDQVKELWTEPFPGCNPAFSLI